MRRIESAMASADRVLAYAEEQASKKSTTMYDSTKEQTEHIIKACDAAIKILTRRMKAATPRGQIIVIDEKPSFAKVNYLYAEVLDRLRDDPIPILAISQCAYYLSRWFHVRVLTKYEGKHLQLHCKYYRNLIPSLVILYGYYLEHNRIGAFQSMFQKFETDIAYGSCTYALPFEAFQIAKSGIGEYGNFAAQLIFDYLWEYGLSELSFRGSQYPDSIKSCGLRKNVVFEKLSPANLLEYDTYSGDPESQLSYFNKFSTFGGLNVD